jgi:hypothetical protein
MTGIASSEEIRAAQIVTLSTLALWLGIGYVQPLRPYANRVRAVLLAAYLIGSAAFVAYVVLR